MTTVYHFKHGKRFPCNSDASHFAALLPLSLACDTREKQKIANNESFARERTTLLKDVARHPHFVEKRSGFCLSSHNASPTFNPFTCSSESIFCMPLKVAPSGIKAQVMALL